MNKTIFLLPIIVLLSGCVAQIGKSDFACPDGTTNSDGVCAGPRTVYELTNDRTDLSDLSNDPEFSHLRPTNTRSNKNPRRHQSTTPDSDRNTTQTTARIKDLNSSHVRDVTVFVPRDGSQQSPNNYQRVEAIPQQRFERHEHDAFQGWPSHDEALAPEPLAVIQAPEVMRVLVAAWPDNAGNLNMPGYVYVEVTERRFNVGSAANTRPSRVVPFQMRQQSQEEIRRQQQRGQGVNPLGVENPFGNQ